MYRMVKNYDDMLSRFHLVPERNGQTDGRMDRQICYINVARQYASFINNTNKVKFLTRVSMLTRVKNFTLLVLFIKLSYM